MNRFSLPERPECGNTRQLPKRNSPDNGSDAPLARCHSSIHFLPAKHHWHLNQDDHPPAHPNGPATSNEQEGLPYRIPVVGEQGVGEVLVLPLDSLSSHPDTPNWQSASLKAALSDPTRRAGVD